MSAVKGLLRGLEPGLVLIGGALAGGLGVLAVVRRDRPLHAFGSSHRAELDVVRAAGLGVPLFDEIGVHQVTVRISRAASLSRRGPDILGLALRATGHGGHEDLLFASTGTGRLGRYLLRPALNARRSAMTTLLPLTSPSGSVQFALFPEGDGRWRLAWGRPGVPTWASFALLTLREPVSDPGHFDPTGSPPQGLTAPRWVRAMRAPAYAAARALVPN